MSKKVELGPIESSSLTPIDLDATSSFLTPSVNKESRANRNLMVLYENIGDDKEVVNVRWIKTKKNKRGELPAGSKLAPQPSEVVELLESQEERGEIDSQVDLPQTGNFGGYKPAADKSDRGETVVEKRDQSPNLLEDDSANSS